MKTRVKELEAEKARIKDKLGRLDKEYQQGDISKKEYVERQYEILDGEFREDAFANINKEISRAKTKRNTLIGAVAILALMLALLPFLKLDGITGFATLQESNTSTMAIGKTYDQNATENLNVNVTMLRATGNVYGYGEAWIYLVNGADKELVYYADTRQGGVTGMVTAGNPVNQSKGKQKGKNKNETVANETETNQTNNETRTNTTNQTINQTSNETTQSMNQTGNETVNQTINETNESQTSGVTASLTLDRDVYSIGDNATINVTPENSTYTLYVHAPSDSYILSEDWWVFQEKGNHTVTAIVTMNNETDRFSKTVKVTAPLTKEFNNVCVDTCNVPETEARIEIVVDGVTLELDSLSYSEETKEEESTSNQSTAQPAVQQKEQSQPSMERRCLLKNPNARPESCFTQEELQKRFPSLNYTILNSLGHKVARVDGQGNMYIQGDLIENTDAEPQQYDYVIDRGNNAMAWIDAVSKDLYLRGQAYENQGSVMWKTKQDDVVTNSQGMYLAVISADGNLYLRGQLYEGGSG